MGNLLPAGQIRPAESLDLAREKFFKSSPMNW